MGKKYAFLDFETTGLNNPVGSDQIIQVAVLKTELYQGAAVELKFHTNVQLEPNKQLPEFITKMTGLTEKSLDASIAMSLADTMDTLRDILKGATLVAQFAPFDMSFMRELDIPEFYCTRTMTTLLYPGENPSLKPTCDRLGIRLENAHTALHDCFATLNLFKIYAAQLGDGLYRFRNVIVDTDARPLTYVPPYATVIDTKEVNV